MFSSRMSFFVSYGVILRTLDISPLYYKTVVCFMNNLYGHTIAIIGIGKLTTSAAVAATAFVSNSTPLCSGLLQYIILCYWIKVQGITFAIHKSFF